MLSFLRRLWVFVRPYQGRLILGLVCGVLYALFNSALVLAINLVVDVVFPDSAHPEKMSTLLRSLIKLLESWVPELRKSDSNAGVVVMISIIPFVMLLRNIFSYLNTYLTNWAAARAIADLRTRLFDHLLNLSVGFFSAARTGDLISRVGNDTQALYGTIGNSLGYIVKEPVTVLTLLIILLTTHRELTLVSLVVLPICLVPIVIYGRKVRKSAKAVQGHLSDLTSRMHEVFTANRIIKAYNLEATVIGQFKEITKKYVHQIMRVVRANEIPSQVTEFLGTVAIALVLLYSHFWLGGKNSPGDFVSFVLAIVLLYQPIKTLTRLHNQLQQARAASQRVFDLLDTGNPVVDPPAPLPLKASKAGIRFENVDFDYGEGPLLRSINLDIQAGQLVALVGRTGSGKTTLTNLLLRFYDPSRGRVCIGDRDIREAAIKDLRGQIALVAQETILFNDTIRQNIVVGRPGASNTEIEAAAKHAYAHDFIMEKPEGYDSIVGEKGVALSGGQRQRLAIARAILKNAPILILDEATNSLDAESELAVQTALEELMEGRTTICIAHKLSTIQKADLIVVLDGGRIIETGTHKQLIQARGTYCKLYELQFEPAVA